MCDDNVLCRLKRKQSNVRLRLTMIAKAQASNIAFDFVSLAWPHARGPSDEVSALLQHRRSNAQTYLGRKCLRDCIDDASSAGCCVRIVVERFPNAGRVFWWGHWEGAAKGSSDRGSLH